MLISRLLTLDYGFWTLVMFLCAKPIFLCRQRPAAGACLAELTGTFPVCFLEPARNQNNPYSIYNTTSACEREGMCFNLLYPIESNFKAKSWNLVWFSFRAGVTWSCGGCVSSLAFSGRGFKCCEAAGWCWSSTNPVHSCHWGYFTHAVQLHVFLVVLGTRGTSG